MMITKITNTPKHTYAANPQQPKDYKLHETPKPDPQPVSDTVTFTSRADKTNEIVDMAFDKLAQTRKGKELGTFIGTLGKTNVHLIETVFGKKADLTIMRNSGFAKFELSRATGENSHIKATDKEISSITILKAVKRYLSESK